MEKSFNMNTHLNTSDENFLEQWNLIGVALNQLNPELLEISLRAIEEAAMMCPPVPGFKPEPLKREVPPSGVYGPIGWPLKPLHGTVAKHQGLFMPLMENLSRHSGALQEQTPIIPSSRIVMDELSSINCLSGCIDASGEYTRMSLTLEGVEHLLRARHNVRFVFLDD